MRQQVRGEVQNRNMILNVTVIIVHLKKQTKQCAHLDVLSGDFTFKLGRFLLHDLDIMQRLRELDVWSC